MPTDERGGMTTHTRERAAGGREPSPTAYDEVTTDRRPGRVARVAPWLAGLWVGVYVPMAALHLVRDTTPPWTSQPASVLVALDSGQMSGVIIVLGLIAAVALGLLAAAGLGLGLGLRFGVRGRRTGAWLLVAIGLVVALVVSDARALSFVGYAPMLLLGLLGIGPVAGAAVDLSTYVDSGLAVGSTMGGFGMLVTGTRALARQDGTSAWGSPERVGRIGRWSVATAVAVPLSYAVTRLAWAAGVPLGVRDEFLVELGDTRWAGFGLAVFAVVGSLLTLGLVQRWGSVFWSWVPVVGGRPVPVGMAVVPALFVAAIVTSAGLGFWGAIFSGHLSRLPGAQEDWAAWAPELLWPAWGIALAVAALAYRQRRLAGGGR